MDLREAVDLANATAAAPEAPDTGPAEPHVVALDTQALREANWPSPSVALRRLAEFAALRGIKLWVVQGALDEVRGSFTREIVASVQKVKAALGTAKQLGLDADGRAGNIEKVLAGWDAKSAQAIAELKAYVSPPTPRTTAEFFEMAIRRDLPFTEKGAGFRDAVIYHSLADEMSRLGLSDAIFVTKDSDFRPLRSPVAGQRIRVMDLAAAVALLERILTDNAAALMKGSIARDLERQRLASVAIQRAAPEIDRFLAENLRVGSGDVDGLRGFLNRPLTLRLRNVEHVNLSPAFEDVAFGGVTDATALLEITGEFEVKPFAEERRLQIGESYFDSMKREAILEALTPEAEGMQVQSINFPVSMDLRLRRTAEGYDEVIPLRVSTLRPSIRGLVRQIPLERPES